MKKEINKFLYFYRFLATEEQDIIQMIIKMDYLEQIIRPMKQADLMEEMQLKVKINEGERAIWQN